MGEGGEGDMTTMEGILIRERRRVSMPGLVKYKARKRCVRGDERVRERALRESAMSRYEKGLGVD